ncbi:GDYXXLXY domain-containing protein [Chryseomicrobium palamuruense]|uniref:GDYXXLXY domain-containing protein n=1 Tax=Chryseomicrobium palamuruense TaxID=682973 RepID=A0ABV8UXM9_9BACL
MRKWGIPIGQTLVASLLVLSFYATTWFGDEYVLRAEPFDPWDPFYGEYVLLQYPDINQAAINADLEMGDEIYFTLTDGLDGYAVVDRLETEDFSGAIKGMYWDRRVSIEALEQYYVEQGRGPELEEAVDLKATIYISPWGSIRPYQLDVRDE